MGPFGDLPAQIIKVVSDPGSNLLGATLLLSMVVLLLLILAVAALVTILPGTHDEDDAPELVGAEEETNEVTSEPEDSREPGAARVVRVSTMSRYLPLLPAVLLVAGVVWGWQLTSSPSQCGSCHAVAGPAGTWAKGDHRTTGCTSCHEDRVAGLPAAVAVRFSNGVAAVGGMKSVEHRRAVPAYRCFRCHQDVRAGTRTVGGIKVRHSDFLDAGYDCIRCHDGVGHSRADAPERAVPMSQCVGCHDGKRAKAVCSTCHVGDTSAAIRVNRSVFPVVDITPRPGCTGCHQTKTCLDCHGIVMPHPAGFGEGQGHARLAAFEGKDRLCYRCHTPQNCKRCHRGDFTTHGSDADWKRRHPSGVPLDGRDACACHTSKDFCGLCHDTSAKR